MIRIFVTDLDRNTPEYEIMDLYWFEENGVHNFMDCEGTWGVHYKFRFEITMELQK